LDVLINSFTSQLPRALFEAIEIELLQHSDGIKEYDLIQTLKPHGFFDISNGTSMLPHELFKVHFLLYHALYVLHDQFLLRKQAYLEIGVLIIKLLPYTEGSDTLSTQNKLREYYLDLSNLENTSEDDVNNLLASFWIKVTNYDKRDDALSILGLEDPVDNVLIKETYRRLAMQHHPDRGGDKVKLQEINAALNILLK